MRCHSHLFLIFSLTCFFSTLSHCAAGNLSRDENEDVQRKCENSNDDFPIKKIEFASGPHHVSYISPRHFLVTARVLNGYYTKETCTERNNDVTAMIVGVTTPKATLIGSCEEDVPAGFVVVETAADVFEGGVGCLAEKKPSDGEQVTIRTSAGGNDVRTVVPCEDVGSEDVFCLDGDVPDSAGPLFQRDSHTFTLVGMANRIHGVKLVAWSLHRFRDEICEATGVCRDRIRVVAKSEGGATATSSGTSSSRSNATTTAAAAVVTTEATTTSEEAVEATTTEEEEGEPMVDGSGEEEDVEEDEGDEEEEEEDVTSSTASEPSSTTSSTTPASISTTSSRPASNWTTTLKNNVSIARNGTKTTLKMKKKKVKKTKKKQKKTSDEAEAKACEEEYLCWEEDVFDAARHAHLNRLLLAVVVLLLVS